MSLRIGGATTEFLARGCAVLELYHHSEIHPGLAMAKVREKDAADSASAGCFRRRQVRGSRSCARTACEELRKAVISARWGDTTAPGEIGDIGMTVSNLQPPGNILSGHVLKIDRTIPHVGLLAGILGEVRRTGCSPGTIDRGQQRQVAAWIVHLASAHGHGKKVLVEPDAII